MNSRPAGTRRWAITALVFLLWMASLALGLFAIYSLQSLALTLYAQSGGREQSIAGLLRWVALAIGGVAVIMIVLAGGEYHMKHAGERKSWIILAWTIAVEIVIIALAALIG